MQVADWRQHYDKSKQEKIKQLASKIKDCKTIINAYHVMYRLYPKVSKERLKVNVNKIVREGLVSFKETKGYPDFWDDKGTVYERYPHLQLLIDKLDCEVIET